MNAAKERKRFLIELSQKEIDEVKAATGVEAQKPAVQAFVRQNLARRKGGAK